MSQGNVWNAERQDTLLCFNAPVFIIVQARGWLGGVVCSVQVQAECSVQVQAVCKGSSKSIFSWLKIPLLISKCKQIKKIPLLVWVVCRGLSRSISSGLGSSVMSWPILKNVKKIVAGKINPTYLPLRFRDDFNVFLGIYWPDMRMETAEWHLDYVKLWLPAQYQVTPASPPMGAVEEMLDICQWRTHNENINCTLHTGGAPTLN